MVVPCALLAPAEGKIALSAVHSAEGIAEFDHNNRIKRIKKLNIITKPAITTVVADS